MTRYLKLSEEEIYDNQRLWAEENKTTMPGEPGPAGDGLGSVGAAPMPTAPSPVDPGGPEAGEPDIATGTQSPLGGDTAPAGGGGETT